MEYKSFEIIMEYKNFEIIMEYFHNFIALFNASLDKSVY